MFFDDVMVLNERFGSTAAELGINETFAICYKAKGKFFDYDCDCCLYFDNDLVFTDYELYVYGDKNGRLINKLNDMYSGPVSSDMTPYAASNGGAVYTYVYESEQAVVSVSMSQKNYYHVNIKPNNNPGYYGKLTLKPSGFKSIIPENVAADIAGYDNGILTVKVFNHAVKSFDISDDFVLFERRGTSFYSKFRISLSVSPVHSFAVLPGKAAEIKLDLRAFGRVIPNEYMVKISDIELYFVLDKAE